MFVYLFVLSACVSFFLSFSFPSLHLTTFLVLDWVRFTDYSPIGMQSTHVRKLVTWILLSLLALVPPPRCNCKRVIRLSTYIPPTSHSFSHLYHHRHHSLNTKQSCIIKSIQPESIFFLTFRSPFFFVTSAFLFCFLSFHNHNHEF